MTASGIAATPSTRRHRRDGAARDAARSPEHLVLLGRVEGQSTLEHREEEDPERPPVDGEVVGLGLCDVESERSRPTRSPHASLMNSEGGLETGPHIYIKSIDDEISPDITVLWHREETLHQTSSISGAI